MHLLLPYFTEFHNHSTNVHIPRTDVWKREKETEAIRLIRSMFTKRMILKLIFQGKKTYMVAYGYYLEKIFSRNWIKKENFCRPDNWMPLAE